MSEIRFELTDWEDPGAARDAALRATWGGLAIRVGEQSVTTLLDNKNRTTRESVFLSLYPLAEWLAGNWWKLLYECRSTSRPARAYMESHCVKFAGEGFALPDLTFQPLGDRVELKWKPRNCPEAAISFLSEGQSLSPLAAVEKAIAELLDLVCSRLEARGVKDTVLQADWRAVRSADKDEAEFCRAAARLGLDPYAVETELADAIVTARDKLEKLTSPEEFYSAVAPERLAREAEWIEKTVNAMRAAPLRSPELGRLRAKMPRPNAAKPLWEQGYNAARWLRDSGWLKKNASPADLQALLQAEVEIARSENWDASKRAYLSGLAGESANGAPVFSFPTGGKEKNNFSLCRAFGEFFFAGKGKISLLTKTVSDRQRRNRAFAAELLAPEAAIRERLNGRTEVDIETIDELSESFNVSSMVIKHQIENHRIADVIS